MNEEERIARAFMDLLEAVRSQDKHTIRLAQQKLGSLLRPAPQPLQSEKTGA